MTQVYNRSVTEVNNDRGITDAQLGLHCQRLWPPFFDALVDFEASAGTVDEFLDPPEAALPPAVTVN